VTCTVYEVSLPNDGDSAAALDVHREDNAKAADCSRFLDSVPARQAVAKPASLARARSAPEPRERSETWLRAFQMGRVERVSE